MKVVIIKECVKDIVCNVFLIDMDYVDVIKYFIDKD